MGIEVKKEFVKVQVSLFFKDYFGGSYEEVSLDIKKQFGSDSISQILGLPEDVPSDLPRLIVNKSGFMSINLSKSRIDLFSEERDFFIKNKEKILPILNKLSVEIQRVGVVCTYFKELDIDSIKLLLDSSKFSSMEFSEINLRLNDIIDFNTFRVNNIQHYVSGFVTDKDKNKKNGVIITRDINNVVNVEKSNIKIFSEKDIFDFVEFALKKSEESLL